YRPAGSYFLFKTTSGAEYSYQWGSNGDKPISGDFVGDSKSDMALYRPAGSYFLIKTTSGAEYSYQFGQDGDIPVPADYIGTSKTDLAVFRPSNNRLYVKDIYTGVTKDYLWGSAGDQPIVPN
ncbi:MAG: hypothetical protein REI11_11615, partial [Patulibacter sp.]|nr:hypothetical protein [Patulibacter sp.]